MDELETEELRQRCRKLEDRLEEVEERTLGTMLTHRNFWMRGWAVFGFSLLMDICIGIVFLLLSFAARH
jgi:hypothetical protein